MMTLHVKFLKTPLSAEPEKDTKTYCYYSLTQAAVGDRVLLINHEDKVGFAEVVQGGTVDMSAGVIFSKYDHTEAKRFVAAKKRRARLAEYMRRRLELLEEMGVWESIAEVDSEARKELEEYKALAGKYANDADAMI